MLFNKRNPKMPSRLSGNVSNFAVRNKAHPVPPQGRVPTPLTPSRGSSYNNLRKAGSATGPIQNRFKSVPYIKDITDKKKKEKASSL